MSSVGYGPLWRIDGPPPVPPKQGLIAAANSSLNLVRILPDVDAAGIDRWMNGTEVYPYPVDDASVFDACSSGSARTKADGSEVPHPQFGAMTVYLPETCTSSRVWDQEAFKARAVAALAGVESNAIEWEFMNGHVLPNNPHLADGNGNFPWGDTATSVMNGIAVLENEIAASGRQGVIHCSPALVIAAAAQWLFAIEDRTGILRTLNGTAVVAGTGYVGSSAPLGGHASPTDTQEWAYATGPIDIRRSEIFTVPDNVSEALDRGSGGATTSRPNSITYRAERYYMVTWDTAVQSAVLIDRCTDECGSPS